MELIDMKRMIKRLVALLLIIAFLLPMIGNTKVYAKDQSGKGKYYYVDICVDDQNNKLCLVKESDNCLMVDMSWLCKVLNLDLFISEDAFQLTTNQTSQSSNYYISKNIQAVEETFKDCKDGLHFSIRKRNTNIFWILSEGSDKACAYSPFLGTITLDLGTSIEVEPISGRNYFWVPIVAFLNLFDSSLTVDEYSFVLHPCVETVFDVLHNYNLDNYYYDVSEESKNSDLLQRINLNYSKYYHRIKSFFSYAVGFHFEKAYEAMSDEYSRPAEAIAIQLCQYDPEELNEVNEICEFISSAACADSDTVKEFGEKIVSVGLDQKAKEASRIVDEFQKKLESVPYEYVSIKEYNEAMKKANEAAKNSDSFAHAFNKFKQSAPIISVALAGAVEYITLTNEIISAQDSSVDSVLTYSQYLKKQNKVYMFDEAMQIITDKAKLYDNTSTNPLNNKTLGNQVLDAIVTEIGAQYIDYAVGEALDHAAQSAISSTVAKCVSSSLFQLKVVSFGWELAEKGVNYFTGGAFDELDAFEVAVCVDILEKDTENVVFSYKNSMQQEHSDDMLDTYRQLEWMRLKSNYLARKNLMGSYQRYEKKKDPELFKSSFAMEIKECSELAHLMSVLTIGNIGTTQKQLDECAKNFKETNKKILSSDILEIADMNLYKKNSSEGMRYSSVDLSREDKNSIAQLLYNYYGDIDYNSEDQNEENMALLMTISPMYGCWNLYLDDRTKDKKVEYEVDDKNYIADPLGIFKPNKKYHASGYSKFDAKTVDWLLRNVCNMQPTHTSEPMAFELDFTAPGTRTKIHVKLKHYYYKGYYYCENLRTSSNDHIYLTNGCIGIMFDNIVTNGIDYQIRYTQHFSTLYDGGDGSVCTISPKTEYATFRKNIVDGVTQWCIVRLNKEKCFDFSPFYADASEHEWKNLYIRYILKYLNKDSDNHYHSFTLAYINDDDIPELIIDPDVMAASSVVCTVYNEKVNSITVWSYGVSYIERKNSFIVDGGRMDDFYHELYKIEKGKFIVTAKGHYGFEGDNDMEHLEDFYSYFWNGEEVSKKQYEKSLNQSFDFSHAISTYDHSNSDAEILKFITDSLPELYPIVD